MINNYVVVTMGPHWIMGDDANRPRLTGRVDTMRRHLLKAPAAAVAASAFSSSSATGQRAQQGVTVSTSDLTGDGEPDVHLENSELSLQLNSEDITNDSPSYASSVTRSSASTPQIDRLGANPKSPINATESPPVEFRQLKSLTVTKDTGQVGAFEIVREYTLDGDYRGDEQPIEITVEVTLYAGDPFVLIDYTLKSISEKSLRIDQDDVDIHDGTQVFSDLQLAGATGSRSDYKFHLNTHGTYRFDQQYLWKTYTGSGWGTIFDDTAGVTAGWLNGTTSPKMWITDGEPVQAIDYLVGEQTLAPGEQFTHELFVGVHDGGADASSIGAEIYDTATARHNGVAPTPTPTGPTFEGVREEKLALTAEIDRLGATLNEEARVRPTLNGLEQAVDNGSLGEDSAIEAVERMLLVEDLAELSLAGLSAREATVADDAESLVGEPTDSVGVDPSMNVLGTTGEFAIELIVSLLSIVSTVSKFVVKLGRTHPVAGALLSMSRKAVDNIGEVVEKMDTYGPLVKALAEQIWSNDLKDDLLSGEYDAAENAYNAVSDTVDEFSESISDYMVSGYETGKSKDHPLDEILERVDSELGVEEGGPTFGGGTAPDGPAEGASTAASNARTSITEKIEIAQEQLDNNSWIGILLDIIALSIVLSAATLGVSSTVTAGLGLIFGLPSLAFVVIGIKNGLDTGTAVLDICDEAATAILDANGEVSF